MTQPRRLVFVSFIAPDPWTGMGRWTGQMLAALDRSGHHARAWYDRDFPLIAPWGRLAVLLFPPALALRLARERHQIDVVVVHEPSGFWYGLLRKLWRSLPAMIVMCHNVESRLHRDMHGYARDGLAAAPSRLRAPLLRHWQSNGSIRLADHVVCLSRVDRTEIIERLGVPAERVTRLATGTEPDDFIERGTQGRQRATGRRVLWIGGWLDVKGRRILPRLWRAVRTRIPDAALTLLGTGAGVDDVLAAFDPIDLRSVAVYPTVRHRQEVRTIFADQDLFLLTSLSEGAPLAVLEAMAAGLPIVATDVGGVPDLVTHGSEALLFDPRRPGDGAAYVCELLQHDDRAATLARTARERARLLTWDAAAAGLSDAVTGVVGESARE